MAYQIFNKNFITTITQNIDKSIGMRLARHNISQICHPIIDFHVEKDEIFDTWHVWHVNGYQGNNNFQDVVLPKFRYVDMSISTSSMTNHHMSSFMWHSWCVPHATHIFKVVMSNIGDTSHKWHHHVIKSWHQLSVLLVLDTLVSVMFWGSKFLVPSLHAPC